MIARRIRSSARPPRRRRRPAPAPQPAIGPVYVAMIGDEVQIVSLDEERVHNFAATYNNLGIRGDLSLDERPLAKIFLADVVLRPDGELPIDYDAPARADARIAELICNNDRRRRRGR